MEEIFCRGGVKVERLGLLEINKVLTHFIGKETDFCLWRNRKDTCVVFNFFYFLLAVKDWFLRYEESCSKEPNDNAQKCRVTGTRITSLYIAVLNVILVLFYRKVFEISY